MTLVSEVLFGYQVEAAERIAEQKAILLADQPGLGKTLEVLGALEIAGLFDRPSRILISTPLINAQTTWADAIERFIKPRYYVEWVDVFSGTSKQRNERIEAAILDKPVFYISNHNSLDFTKNGVRVPNLVQPYDAVIVDESHIVLPITGNKLTQFQRGLGKVTYLSGSNIFRIAISGTPDRGKLENRFGTWNFLYPNIVGHSRWAWLEEHFFLTEQRVSRSRVIKVPVSLKDKRKWQLYSSKWMIRRTKAEVLSQLPPKQYVDVELQLGSAQRLRYLDFQIQYEAALRSDEENVASAMVYAIRSRQVADCMWTTAEKPEPIVGGESIKLDWLLEWLDERGFIQVDELAGNSKVVIVSQFSAVLHWLKQELANRGVWSEVLDGATSNHNRVGIQADFQAGGLRVVLLSGGMGVGINLDQADDLIMFDSPYDPDRVEQIEDRVHRASNMHHVTIWNLIGRNTIDEAIAEIVNKRYHTTRRLLDEDRGISIERNVLKKLAILKERSNGN